MCVILIFKKKPCIGFEYMFPFLWLNRGESNSFFCQFSENLPVGGRLRRSSEGGHDRPGDVRGVQTTLRGERRAHTPRSTRPGPHPRSTHQVHTPGPHTRPTHHVHTPGPHTRPTHQAHTPDRKSTRLNSSHAKAPRTPSSA